MSAQKIEAELTTLTENFANLVRSARINEDTDDTKKSQVWLSQMGFFGCQSLFSSQEW